MYENDLAYLAVYKAIRFTVVKEAVRMFYGKRHIYSNLSSYVRDELMDAVIQFLLEAIPKNE